MASYGDIVTHEHVSATKGCARRVTALLVFCICGCAGVLLDLDHILVLWIRGLPITLPNLADEAGRPLHIPAMLVMGAFALIFSALFARRTVVDDN